MMSDANQSDKETVPCDLCGRPTRMTSTRLCDSCWVLACRVDDNVPLMLKILKRNHNMRVIEVLHTCDCPFNKSALELVELQGGDCGHVCDILRLGKGGRARCNSSYPPRYCPLQNSKILITIKRD